MKQIILFTFVFALMNSCKENSINLETEKQIVLKTDLEFSDFSEKNGMKNAFLKFADTNAVILKNNSLPIEGKEEIGKSYINLTDSVFTLTWKPLTVFISESVDLAYTYGTYNLQIKNDASVTRGTYLTIWKKQEDGSWKWVLDTGNDGLE